ncbi:MAG TPA: carboxymuconolactone decarboxylase family protein [Gammaproteobacteria bacterium]|nr:carboxymuconolactone decarboxylase family protein [Gammaproteobacteria bacterium]
MARVAIVKPDNVDDPVIREIFDWVTGVESAVPNHFYVELNFPEFLKAKLGATQVLWRAGELSLPEIQHVGILVSQANGCPYCTAAFCTILNYGLGTPEAYVQQLVTDGIDVVDDERLRTIVAFALKVNGDAKAITDTDTDGLRAVGLTDKGIVQLVHLVSDFAAYNRLNLALDTDYDYRDMWRAFAFGWEQKAGEEASADNTRGVRPDESAAKIA